MPEVVEHIDRFRKNLKQFLELKVSGKLNGSAAKVQKKLEAAADAIELDFDEELKSIFRDNPSIRVKQLEGTDSGDDLPLSRADSAWILDNVNVEFSVKPWHTDPEKAAAEFNLKGIEFGNWLNAENRVEYLAETMQALHYISKVLGVSHKQIGIGGKLGIAFGARGKGGYAVAHYEPVSNVMINLTKEKGQRALAHEYTHALDNLAGWETGRKYMSGGRSANKAKDFLDGTDPLTKTANNFFNALFWSDGEKSNYFNRMVSATEYEQRRTEILARCGDIYITQECKDRDLPTGYVGTTTYGRINPTKEEFKEVQPHLKSFFNQVFDLFEGKDLDEVGSKKEEKPKEKIDVKSEGGKQTTVDFKPDGSQSKKGRYQLIELKDLTASHNKDCSVNSKHRISKGQPRDRSLDNLCAQPKFIAKNLNPSSITQGNLAFQGAPVVTSDGMVIQGNGRSISLKIAYDEIPEKVKKYKNYLANHAKEFGFKKSDVTGMKQPVLVRMLDVDDKEAIRLGNIVDTSQAKMSRIDQAKAIIRNLDSTKLQAIGRIIASSNGETIGAIIDDIGIRIFDQVKDLDRTGLIEKGELTSDGKEFLRSVLTGIIFDSEKQKAALRDFLDNPHTIQAGLERSFGNIIPLIGQKGDIREQIQEAVQITAEVKRNDAFDSVDDVMSATDMFTGQKDYSTQGQDLARFLLDVNTQKEIRDAFRIYTSHIEGKDDLFNPIKATTQPKAFDAAFVKRKNPPEHIVKLLAPADFKKGDILRDYYEDKKYWIERIKGKTYHVRSLANGKKETFQADEKRFIRNRPVTPTMDMFKDVRKNFEISLTPKKETKATKRFKREGTDFEKAVVRAMVNDENYKTFVNNLPEEKRKGFYQNLSWRLSLFTGPNDEPLWHNYINKPLSKFAEAIKREAKNMYKADLRGNPITFIENSKGNVDFGEITSTIAKKIKRQAGKIRVTEEGLSHVKKHSDEIKEKGHKSIITFIEDVTSSFDKIYQDRGALLLVRSKNPSEMAVIRLEPFEESDFYIVKTALVVRNDFFKKRKPLWEKAQSTHRKNATPGAVSGHNGLSKTKKNPAKMLQNGNRTDIRLVKPKYQFSSESEAWETVQLTTGLRRDQVKPAHTNKSWRWVRTKRSNPKMANRTDIRLVKPKDQFDTIDDAWESVHNATGLFPVQVQPAHTKKAWRWMRIDEPRQNPKARFVMLGISKKLVIEDESYGYKEIALPMAMFTNKKKDKLFLTPFSELKELDFDVKDKAAEEVFEMWHNYPADKKDYEIRWPNIPAGPIGYAHSILYASDKVMREWDAKGKLNLYEHDFDSGLRPAFRKGRIIIIANLKINERGILN